MPDAGYSGSDSFTYTATDGQGTDSAEVHITVVSAPAASVYMLPDPCEGGMMLIVNGTTGADSIHVAAVSGGSGVDVSIGGVSQGTYFPTGRILIFGYAGDDAISLAGSVFQHAWVYGDAGNDQLNLGNGGAIAWGGDGNDHINGGTARDILVGGQGADRIVGNPGDDILCAGWTQYDDRFSATSDHEEAWCHLYEEWSRTDLTTQSIPGDASYTAFEQRIDHLRGPAALGTAGGHNGIYFLNDATVNDDNDYDQIDLLTGSSGEDWFLWTKGEDKVNGMSSAEGAEDLDTISTNLTP
jgi:Ca2+-binding RTX toxin-like protein